MNDALHESIEGPTTSGQLPMRCSPTIDALVLALAKAQGQFPPIGKDKTAKIQTKTGAAYSYAYADLATILAAVRKPLSDHALAVMQPIRVNGRTVSVTTIVAHGGSGQWIADELDMPIGDPADARSLASAATYARRYGLIALLGIAPAEEDDDGAQAVTTAVKPPRRPDVVPAPPPRSAAAPVISEPQRKKLFAEARARGWTSEQLKPWLLAAYGIESTTLIPQSQFDEILERVALERPGEDREPGEDG